MMSKEVARMIEVKEYKSKQILIKELGEVGMITVRGDLSNKQFQADIAKTCQLDVPKPLTINSNKKLSVAWMSSDELLILNSSRV